MHHPNIVAYKENFITESTAEDGQSRHLCILMEYCDSGDVYTYLQKVRRNRCIAGPAEEPLVLEWFIQIVAAVHFLHDRSILHRDLKTQNIFLMHKADKAPLHGLGGPGPDKEDITTLQNCIIKLGDFGIAKVLDSTIDLAKTQIGTPFYMSPEVFKNANYSYKSDIWGIGCVLYELICGKHTGREFFLPLFHHSRITVREFVWSRLKGVVVGGGGWVVQMKIGTG